MKGTDVVLRRLGSREGGKREGSGREVGGKGEGERRQVREGAMRERTREKGEKRRRGKGISHTLGELELHNRATNT